MRSAAMWNGARSTSERRWGSSSVFWRLRDWLRLLAFEVETVRSAVIVQQASRLWLEASWAILGEKWRCWRCLLLVAVKRVPGMRSARALFMIFHGACRPGCHGAVRRRRTAPCGRADHPGGGHVAHAMGALF